MQHNASYEVASSVSERAPLLSRLVVSLGLEALMTALMTALTPDLQSLLSGCTLAPGSWWLPVSRYALATVCPVTSASRERQG